MPILSIRDLVKHFPVRGGLMNKVIRKVHAVNGVSFDVERGEVLGVVGESGCGKSTLGKSIVRLHKPTSGSVVFDNTDISKASQAKLRPIRKRLQMIFQDPNSSLNPRMTIGAALKEVIRFHDTASSAEVDDRVIQLLERVGMRAETRTRYPHEFSGGQKQRVGIARALAVEPDFVVADEPVSALDVSIQAQVLNLMMDLKKEFDLTMLFVSHDLKVIDHFCDRMLVMYLGYVVEEMKCDDVHANAKHPYTTSLLGANPPSDPDDRKELTILEGEVPSPYDPPAGCPFVTRCPLAHDKCRAENPPLVEITKGHRVACWEVQPES